ncbi:hypothetical protein [Shewanella sp. AC91-MNA-CIBAN-0169]|uniref:hypothetical protein n=1 Tax=unclassified Shewanella TaxID=196818 RepID=UPI00332AA478
MLALVFLSNNDLAAGRLVPILQSDKFTHIEREQVNAVFYTLSIVARRISAFIEFIQPRLTL